MIGDTRLAGSVAVLHDMAEEGWPSMDQMGHLLTIRVPALAPGLSVTPIHHPMTRIASAVNVGPVRPLFAADRILNRMVLYPRRVKRLVSGRFDIYHIVDHSYAQLALALPPHRTIVSCHDIDTFRSLVQPAEERRGRLFNAMTGRILAGLRRAAIVVCGSAAAHQDLVRFRLVDPSRLRTVPNGIDPGLLEPPSTAARSRAEALLPPVPGVVDLLHVGNDIPRKRLDRLIDVIATLRTRRHRIRLVRVGSPLREETRRRMAELAVRDFIELPFIDRAVLRAVYERCQLLVLTSDREGYGLPVLEAFAAGTPVVASDIPALRESSGGLATLVPAESLEEWVSAIERVLQSADPGGALAAERRMHAAARTWDDHVRALLPVYGEIMSAR